MVACASLLLALSTGCEQPVVAASGAPAVAGGVKFELGTYEVRYLELHEGDQSYEYAKPVLIVPITITNEGEGAVSYNPTHDAPQMAETSTPLLYPDPGAEAKLPPAQKTPIQGALISKGKLSKQVRDPVSLAKGDSVTDLYTFELPPEGTSSLIFSVPPAWHRGEAPTLLRLSYQPVKPKGPKVFALGEGAEFSGVTFSVTSVDTLYVKTKDTAQGEGFSTNPLFKVSYKIENGGDDAVSYDPNHRAVAGASGARLFSGDGPVKRVQFGPTTSADGQLDGKQEIAAGKSVEDYVLFQQPDKDASELTLEFPATLFERVGTARVRIEHEHKTPEKPKELEKKK